MKAAANRFWITILALGFVVVYGSGFVAAKLAWIDTTANIQPFYYLFFRFTGTATILLTLILLFRIRWPERGYRDIILSGILLQGVMSGGAFYAIHLGLKPAVSALVISLQPILVWLLVSLTTRRQIRWLSVLALIGGIAGVAITVYDGLGTQGLTWANVSICIVGLFGLVVGQFYYQLRNPRAHLLVTGFLQGAASAVIMGLGAILFESLHVAWSLHLIISELWMILGVSMTAYSLLFVLTRYESADRVASFFYAVPISAALIAWPVLGQTPTTLDWFGFGVIVVSILVFNRSTRLDAGK
jgi:drug/metabolite transporter (DMT)-like permease